MVRYAARTVIIGKVLSMKKWLVFICALLVPMASMAKNYETSFDDKTYYLKFSNISPAYSVNEYIPEGEAIEHWNEMIAVHVYHRMTQTDPIAFAHQLGKMIVQRNPAANYEVVENKELNEAILTFLTWTTRAPHVAEYSLYKLKQNPKTKDIAAYQYGKRFYGEFNSNNPAADQFVKQFMANHPKWLLLVAKAKLPEFVTERVTP